MDINFKGYVPVEDCTTVHGFCFDVKESYSPSKGANAGKNMGSVAFLRLAKSEDKEMEVVYDSPNVAFAALAKAKFDGKTYVDCAYVTPTVAAKADVHAVVWKNAGFQPNVFKGLAFCTAGFIAAKNGGKVESKAKKPTGKAAKKSNRGF